MKKCTGRNCIMQYDKVDPATCQAVTYCPQVTPPKTNADKIRAMSDEELAKFFADYVSCHDCPIPYCNVRFTMERLGCQANWLDWLRQEAE